MIHFGRENGFLCKHLGDNLEGCQRGLTATNEMSELGMIQIDNPRIVPPLVQKVHIFSVRSLQMASSDSPELELHDWGT
ncbi:MAG: hypothetical protein RLZZ245_35 [Verrucomicrobiota bacterium]